MRASTVLKGGINTDIRLYFVFQKDEFVCFIQESILLWHFSINLICEKQYYIVQDYIDYS